MFQPGEIIEERYIIASVLGKGGAGTVYLAEDMITRTPVAIKASRSVLVLRESSTLSHERLIYEALSGVPGIPVMQDFLTVNLRHLLVLPYLGKSMQQIFVTRGPLTRSEACRMGVSILETIQAMHEKRVLHLDIKPENILYDGSYHVTDFGSARFMDGVQGRRYIGTPAFSSVSIDRGEVAGKMDDYESLIYSICAVVGRLPWLTAEWSFVESCWRDVKQRERGSVGNGFPDAFKRAWRGVRERSINYAELKELLSLAATQAEL